MKAVFQKNIRGFESLWLEGNTRQPPALMLRQVLQNIRCKQ